MSFIIAGATSGLLMSSIFTAIVPLILVKDFNTASPTFKSFVNRVSPMTLMMAIVIISFPVWAIIGGAMGLVYREVLEHHLNRDYALFSPTYSLLVSVIGIGLATPWILLVKKHIVGVMTLMVTFIGIFALILPLLAK